MIIYLFFSFKCLFSWSTILHHWRYSRRSYTTRTESTATKLLGTLSISLEIIRFVLEITIFITLVISSIILEIISITLTISFSILIALTSLCSCKATFTRTILPTVIIIITIASIISVFLSSIRKISSFYIWTSSINFKSSTLWTIVCFLILS